MKEQRLVQVAREVLQTIAALSSDRPCSQTIVQGGCDPCDVRVAVISLRVSTGLMC